MIFFPNINSLYFVNKDCCLKYKNTGIGKPLNSSVDKVLLSVKPEPQIFVSVDF